MMVRDNEVDALLIKKLHQLVEDESMQQIMAMEIKQLAIPDADNRIAQRISEVIE